MSSIQSTPSFSFHNNSIRVQGTPDNPLFCLADVCKVLALTDPSKTVKQIKEEFELTELNSGSFDTGFGIKKFTMITEPQLYFVMMRSRAKLAKAFRQWIVNDVIPTIRKNGSYTQQENKKTSSYIQIFNQFCAEHRYSNEERAMFLWFKEQAIRQGYAIACAKFKEQEPERQLKDDEIAISKETAKQIFKILDFSAKHKKEMMEVASAMREQASVLMLAAEGYEFTKSVVRQTIFNKL